MLKRTMMMVASSSKFVRNLRDPTMTRTPPQLVVTTRRNPSQGAGIIPSEKESHIKHGKCDCISSSNHVCNCLSDPGIHQLTMDALPRWILEMEENSREPKTRPARRARLPGTTRTKNGGQSTLDSLKEEQAQRILPRFLR